MLSFILFAINIGNSVFNFSKTTKNLTVIDKKRSLFPCSLLCFVISGFFIIHVFGFFLCTFWCKWTYKKTQLVRILFMLILLNLTKNIFLNTNIWIGCKMFTTWLSVSLHIRNICTILFDLFPISKFFLYNKVWSLHCSVIKCLKLHV